MIINEAEFDRAVKPIIAAVHDVACRYGYNRLQASRISFESESDNSWGLKQSLNNTSLIIHKSQGLCRATHQQFGEVLLKWELLKREVHAVDKTKHSKTLQIQNRNSLAYECHILRQLSDSALSVPLLEDMAEVVVLAGSRYHLSIAVRPYYAFGSLKHYLKTYKISSTQKITLLLTAAKTLANLHDAGWIHGDIKPSNFLLADDVSTFELVLNDFALATPIDGRLNISGGDHEALTMPQGTPAYLAPECWQGQGLSLQSDIYAFGVMLVEVLTGEKPYQIQKNSDESQDSIVSKWAIVHCQAAIPSLPIAWRGYQSLVEGMLAKRREVRIDNMSVVTERLRELHRRPL